MGFGGFPILAIKFIAFAHYPPRSETSHDGGLVDLFTETHKPHVLAIMVDCYQIFTMLGRQGDTFRETEGSQDMMFYRHVKVQLDLVPYSASVKCP